MKLLKFVYLGVSRVKYFKSKSKALKAVATTDFIEFEIKRTTVEEVNLKQSAAAAFGCQPSY